MVEGKFEQLYFKRVTMIKLKMAAGSASPFSGSERENSHRHTHKVAGRSILPDTTMLNKLTRVHLQHPLLDCGWKTFTLFTLGFKISWIISHLNNHPVPQ